MGSEANGVCGRYFLTATVTAIAAEFDAGDHLSADATPPPRFNIAPGQLLPIVRRRETGRELASAWWGLLPKWAQDESIASRLINARSETVHEKPSFRDALRHRRCLIPSSGFYEWKREAGGKQPFACLREGGALHAMAGLWEAWRNPETGQTRETCTILTCPANTRLRVVHDRMPVILHPVDWDLWLDPRIERVEPLRALFRSDPARLWTIRPVSRRVNNPRNDDSALLEPEPAESEGHGLFGRSPERGEDTKGETHER